MFGALIVQSAAHIYISALPFSPRCSPIYHILERFPQTVKLDKGRLTTWPNVIQILKGHRGGVRSVAFSRMVLSSHRARARTLAHPIRRFTSGMSRMAVPLGNLSVGILLLCNRSHSPRMVLSSHRAQAQAQARTWACWAHPITRFASGMSRMAVLLGNLSVGILTLCTRSHSPQMVLSSHQAHSITRFASGM